MHVVQEQHQAGTTADSIANTTTSNNSWNTVFSVRAADFVSVDTSLATVARNPDGTLLADDLSRLAKGSNLIDAGPNVGLPHSGSATNPGAFESVP